MSLPPNRLFLRRQSDNEMAAVLEGIYIRLRREGMDGPSAYAEVMHLLETRTDNLSRMGIPPTWERAVAPDPSS